MPQHRDNEMQNDYRFSQKDVDDAWEVSKKWFEYYAKRGPEPTDVECEYEALVRTAHSMFIQNKVWPTLGEVLAP
jgi:hypothetical protein